MDKHHLLPSSKHIHKTIYVYAYALELHCKLELTIKNVILNLIQMCFVISDIGKNSGFQHLMVPTISRSVFSATSPHSTYSYSVGYEWGQWSTFSTSAFPMFLRKNLKVQEVFSFLVYSFFMEHLHNFGGKKNMKWSPQI